MDKKKRWKWKRVNSGLYVYGIFEKRGISRWAAMIEKSQWPGWYVRLSGMVEPTEWNESDWNYFYRFQGAKSWATEKIENGLVD